MVNQLSFGTESLKNTPVSADVAIVDDDFGVRDSLALALGAHNAVTSFHSAEALLEWVRPDRAAIIVCDLNMPTLDGIGLLAELRKRGIEHPVILLTGFGDVSRAVGALKAGAFDFLEKPCPIEKLEEVIARAQDVLHQRAQSVCALQSARNRLAKLSGREAEVLDHLIEGQSNKKIAQDLGLSPRTVEIYRAKVMSKMQAGSLSELVRTALMVRPMAFAAYA